MTRYAKPANRNAEEIPEVIAALNFAESLDAQNGARSLFISPALSSTSEDLASCASLGGNLPSISSLLPALADVSNCSML
jgi:hypothetical protein